MRGAALKNDDEVVYRIDLYTRMIEHIVRSRKGALPLETLKMAIRTVRRKHPNLTLMTIDRRYKVTSLMPDNKDSMWALKAFLTEIYNSTCLLVDVDMAKHIFMNPCLEFCSENLDDVRQTGLIEHLPDFMMEDIATFVEGPIVKEKKPIVRMSDFNL
jgi:hypothetical protein